MMTSMACRLFLTTILLSVLSISNSQSVTSSTDIDESLTDRWDDSLDFEGCFSDLMKSDRNGDGVVKKDEYLSFIQEYGKRICFTTDELSVQQKGVFNTLACLCASEAGNDENCCMGSNAQIPTAGVTSEKRTPKQTDFLTSVCKLTDATIDGTCRPTILDRDTPIVPILPDNIVPTPPPPTPAGGLDWWEWLLIALAALLLLCLACCCVWKKRQGEQDEEEEEEENAISTKMDEENLRKQDDYADPEQPRSVDEYKSPVPPPAVSQEVPNMHDMPASNDTMAEQMNPYEPPEEEVLNSIPEPELQPGFVPPMVNTAKSTGAVVGDDSDEEDEVRKKSGGQRLPNEPDEELVIIKGAPPFPPVDPEPSPPKPLKPIPDKESEDDEWDAPGRNLEYPTKRDGDEGQTFEPYIPDGGVVSYDRPTKDPVEFHRDWQRQYPEEPEEYDNRKHRVQLGLGEGAVWDKLGDDESSIHKSTNTGNATAFDWVIQSALGALDNENNNNTPSSKAQKDDNASDDEFGC
jgi:hypothetical protein